MQEVIDAEIPEDVSGALLDHTREHLSGDLSQAYALWSRSAEYVFLSRACAAVEPARVLGRGLGLQRFSGSLRRHGQYKQSFSCPYLCFWSLVHTRLYDYWKCISKAGSSCRHAAQLRSLLAGLSS